MKKLILTFCSLLMVSTCFAESYLKWDPVEAPDGMKPVLGYLIHYTRPGMNDDYVFDCGNVLTYPLETGALNLGHGVTYDFFITAYNADGEGDPSNDVTWTRPPNAIPENNLPDTIIIIPPGSSINVRIETHDK